MLRAVKIRMEYLEHPVGLGGLPWFGWVLESDRKNVVQKDYRLQIAEDSQFERLIYDSGVVESRESVHVEVPAYGGAAAAGEDAGSREGRGEQEAAGVRGSGVKLRSCTEYFVRVRVSDGVEESPYSETASFVTGILEQGQWQAAFITAEKEADSGKSGSTCLRKQIRIDGRVSYACVCATAFGLYRFFINGEKVGEDESDLRCDKPSKRGRKQAGRHAGGRLV